MPKCPATGSTLNGWLAGQNNLRSANALKRIWWDQSTVFGNYAAGFFGSFYSVMTKGRFFGMLALAGIITGGVFFLIRRPVVRVMQTKM
jgi:hypothetical protein